MGKVYEIAIKRAGLVRPANLDDSKIGEVPEELFPVRDVEA